VQSFFLARHSSTSPPHCFDPTSLRIAMHPQAPLGLCVDLGPPPPLTPSLFITPRPPPMKPRSQSQELNMICPHVFHPRQSRYPVVSCFLAPPCVCACWPHLSSNNPNCFHRDKGPSPCTPTSQQAEKKKYDHFFPLNPAHPYPQSCNLSMFLTDQASANPPPTPVHSLNKLPFAFDLLFFF